MASTPEISELQRQFTPLVQKDLSETLVTASLLSDDEVMQLGVWDFDPNRLLGTDNDEFGSDEARAIRDSLNQVSLPWNKLWLQTENGDQISLTGKFAALQVKQRVQLDRESRDLAEHRVYSAHLGVSYLKNFTDHWQGQARFSASWMHYENTFEFISPLAKAFKPVINGVFSNYDVNALMFEPTIRLNYRWQGRNTRYRLFSAWHYLFGQTIHADIDAHDVRPHAWYWSNGIELSRPVFRDTNSSQQLWSRFSRVNVGGYLSEPTGSSHYYELGAGWLINTPKFGNYVTNLGVGINLNYGSTLKGGTLVILYNIGAF
ncbi:Solitary outer membrane autotransporter beta-barrel domain [Alteromonas aestuariivivens]|nr:Solitary outer membrane autotransporter beta-barrel domain [Alteromonas aestuariivivens]